MKYFLVEQSVNYADEFDVEGFWIQEAESEEEILDECLKNFEEEQKLYNSTEEVSYPVECCFGTNEYIEFESQEDYLSSLSVTEITREEYKVMERIMPSFGDTF